MEQNERSIYKFKSTSSIVMLVCLFLLLFSTTANASSASFDYNAVKKEIQLNKDMDFILNEEPQSHNAFISTDLFTVSERSFEHDNSSSEYYSYFYNDWIVNNYDSNNAMPTRRLWLYYSSVEPITAQAVTFSFANNDYTFEEIFYVGASLSNYENGDSQQKIVIMFGEEHLSFMYALEDYIMQTETSADIWNLPKVKITFHGTKDITTELPNTFLFDFVYANLIPLGNMTLPDVLAMNEVPNRMKTSSSYIASVPVPNRSTIVSNSGGIKRMRTRCSSPLYMLKTLRA